MIAFVPRLVKGALFERNLNALAFASREEGELRLGSRPPREASTADARRVRRRDDRGMFAGVVAVAVGNVAAFARGHAVDPEVERARIERFSGQAKHGRRPFA